jgi:N-acetylglucosamine kinase-like BadF-type ATPase
VTVPAVLAVDGGNSKTDVALVDADGGVLGAARGPGASHHHLGVPAALEAL